MFDVDMIRMSQVQIGPEILAARKLCNMTQVEIKGNTRTITYNWNSHTV